MAEMSGGILLRDGRVLTEVGAAPVRQDIAIDAHGRIREIGGDLPAGGAREIHVDGKLVMPGLVDLHQHLDKSRTLADAPNPEGTLAGAVAAFRDYAGRATPGKIVERARRTVEACIARGTVAIRSHVNVDLETRLAGVEAIIELRRQLRDRVNIEIVAFATSSAARADVATARELLEAALDLGADVVGGTPNFAPDPRAYLAMLFDVAERRGCRIDLHVDESLDPQQRCLAEVIALTRRRAMGGRVVAGHCCSLSAMGDDEAIELAHAAAEAGVGIVTLPAANLFLQGRERTQAPPRGLTRITDLRAAGVPVACASDNIQDAFVPMGTGDMLEIARWTALSGHLLADAANTALRMVTTTPAALMGIADHYGIRPGAWADLVIVDAETGADAVASGPLERQVIFHGKQVAGPQAAAGGGTHER